MISSAPSSNTNEGGPYVTQSALCACWDCRRFWIGYLLQPGHEVRDQVTELLLRLLVIDSSLLVETNGLVEPVNDELIGEYLFIKEVLHECGGEFTKLGVVLPNEE